MFTGRMASRPPLNSASVGKGYGGWPACPLRGKLS